MINIKKTSRNIYSWYEKNFLIILTVFSAVLAALIFFIYGYIDLKSLTIWSLNLLDVFWEGRPYEYYAYCAENIYNVDSQYMGSGYIGLIPWAVWNIPIWILQRWFGVAAVGHAWTLLYSKLFPVMVGIVMVYYIYKITMYFTSDIKKSVMAAYLAFSSPFVLTSVHFAGQTDVISLCLFIIAVYKLLNNNKLLFLVLAALSIAVKPYVLVAYIAVILVVEKNIWKICAYAFAGSSIMLIFNLIYANAPMYRESMSSGPTGGQMDALLSVFIEGGIGQKIPLFVVALILCYFYIYVQKYEGEKNFLIVHCAAVTFFLFLMLTAPKAYRMIYMAPFMYILFMYKKDNLQLNLLLETIGSICAVIVFYIRNERFFSSWYVFQFIRDMLSTSGGEGELLSSDVLSNVRISLGQETMQPYIHILAAVYCTAFVLVIIINWSGFKRVNAEEMKLGTKSILWIRSLILVPAVILSLYGN